MLIKGTKKLWNRKEEFVGKYVQKTIRNIIFLAPHIQNKSTKTNFLNHLSNTQKFNRKREFWIEVHHRESCSQFTLIVFVTLLLLAPTQGKIMLCIRNQDAFESWIETFSRMHASTVSLYSINIVQITIASFNNRT